MSSPRFKNRPYLPETIQEPDDPEKAVVYREGIYRTVSYAVNARDFTSEPFRITDVPELLDLPRSYGSFLILISGVADDMPALTSLVLRPSSSRPAVFNNLATAVGTAGKWNGHSLHLTSSAQGVVVYHDAPEAIGVFYVRILT